MLAVVHSFQVWLPLTMTWAYNQVRYAPAVEATVVADELQGAETFPWEPLLVLSRSDRMAAAVGRRLGRPQPPRSLLARLRRRAPARLVLAVPVAPADTLARLKDAVDEIICLQVPADFRAVGLYYRDFSQTTDAEVIAALDTAAS